MRVPVATSGRAADGRALEVDGPCQEPAPAAGHKLPVFVINLDRSADRLAFIGEQARAIGLAFERIAAIDGTAVPGWLRGQFLDDAGKPLSSLIPSEIGCYASHLVVHRRIVDDGLPWALVLEDDVKLEPDLVTAATAAIAAAPAGWDYIHLSGLIRHAVYSLAELPNRRHLIRHTLIAPNTGGYLISRSGARKMLAAGVRSRPVDQDFRFAWLRDLDVFGVYPSPVIWGDHMPTTIDWRVAPKRHWGLRFPRLGGYAYAARKLGAAAFLVCAWTNLKLNARRRLLKRLQGAALVVRGAQAIGRRCDRKAA
jgi:glycosyl transferase, family 25